MADPPDETNGSTDGNATRRAQSRDRYRFYRDRGYTLNTHQV